MAVEKSNYRLFGTSGIRGYTNLELTPRFTVLFSESYACWLLKSEYKTMFKEQQERRVAVAIAHDTRYGAKMLEFAFASGLMSMGIDVMSCGCIPTPTLATYIANHELLYGGVMITGSHMPSDRIGLIILDADGCYLEPEKSAMLEQLHFERMDKLIKSLKWDKFANVEEPLPPPPQQQHQEQQQRRRRPTYREIGNYQSTHTSAIDTYKNFLSTCIRELKNLQTTESKKLRILVDPCNGTASKLLPEILREFVPNVEIIEINTEPKPEPDRAPEPRATTLDATANAVKSTNCELGIATDTDADRVLFITDKGTVIPEDIIGALFAETLIRQELSHADFGKEKYSNGNNRKNRICIVTPVNSSGLIEHICKKYQVELIYCKIGQPHTEATIKKHRANTIFGYEETGKYYFPRNTLNCDGILTALKLIEIIIRSNKSLFELVQAYPKLYQVKYAVECDEKIKPEVIRRVYELLATTESLLEGKLKDINLDGFKRIYTDNSWLLIRPSGTEPLIRVYTDASSLTKAQKLADAGVELVSTVIDKLSRRS